MTTMSSSSSTSSKQERSGSHQHHHIPHPKPDAVSHYAASGLSAVLNFPLWKASAIGQSGFQLQTGGGGHVGGVGGYIRQYLVAIGPPYRGVIATWLGMTWARATIFYGSEQGKQLLERQFGVTGPWGGAIPALVTSTFVQIINMPIIRATISLQNPASPHTTAREALQAIYRKSGLKGLWLGTPAGIAKTVPKYMTAVVVKDFMELWLDPVEADTPHSQMVQRSAIKAVTAGFAGAVLTNPLDVLRNECFKREQPVRQALRGLYRDEGLAFLHRGLGKNVIAVTIPIAATIFLADIISRARNLAEEEEQGEQARVPLASSSSSASNEGGGRVAALSAAAASRPRS